MYEKLPLDFIGVTDNFGYSKLENGTQKFHYGVDLGWHNYQGEPIYAIYDSEVVYESYDVNLGNYIVLKYDKKNNTIIYRYLHLNKRTTLKKGEKVKRGQIVGYMGTTGDSTGVHLHFEYWICPKNYNYYYGDRADYAVNPLDYCYLFDDQDVSNNTVDLIQRVVGSSLNKNLDSTKDQIEVTGDKLRCRKNYGLDSQVLGYIDYGIYNILDKKEKDGYTWYKLDENKWIAGVLDSVNVYLVKENAIDEDNNIDKPSLSPNKNPININEYNSFTALKNDYYYIYLKENETVYFPK